MMNTQLASCLVEEHQRELTRQADARRPAASARVPRHRVPDLRVPRYRVHWTRMTLPAVGAAGRRERSWVLVISASRSLRRA
jgi:hypothetical protein